MATAPRTIVATGAIDKAALQAPGELLQAGIVRFRILSIESLQRPIVRGRRMKRWTIARQRRSGRGAGRLPRDRPDGREGDRMGAEQGLGEGPGPTGSTGQHQSSRGGGAQVLLMDLVRLAERVRDRLAGRC
ncbi:MAG: hypothetical protein KF861_24620, partial [Planctomycetaceae bacterium]|nr:hypothetical protein [Planctomycetaceae bacterium]